MSKLKTTEKVFNKELLNDQVLKSLEYYSHVNDILQRTYIALGRKKTYKVTNVSTNDVALVSNDNKTH